MVSAEVRVAKARVVFSRPGPQVNGLEAVPEGLWLSDQQDNRTYLVDYSGKVLTSFASPARNASGTSYGAGSVWVASNVRPSMVFRHEPQTGHCTAALLLPNADQGGVHGVQWRPYEPGEQPPPPPPARSELHPNAPAGKLNAGPGVSGTLWVTRPGTKVIDHVDAETGEVLGQLPSPRPAPTASSGTSRTAPLTSWRRTMATSTASIRKPARCGTSGASRRAEVHAMTRSADGRIWVGDAPQTRSPSSSPSVPLQLSAGTPTLALWPAGRIGRDALCRKDRSQKGPKTEAGGPETRDKSPGIPDKGVDNESDGGGAPQSL